MPVHVTTVGELLDTYRTNLLASIDNQWIKYQLQPLLEHSWLLTLGSDLYAKPLSELNYYEKQKISTAMEFFVSKISRAIVPYMSTDSKTKERVNTEKFCNAFNAYGQILFDFGFNNANALTFGAKINNAAFGLYCFNNGMAAGYYVPTFTYKNASENHVISYERAKGPNGYSSSSGWGNIYFDPYPYNCYHGCYHDPVIARLIVDGIQFQIQTATTAVNFVVDSAQQTLPIMIDGVQTGAQLVGDLLSKMPDIGSAGYQAAEQIVSAVGNIAEMVIDSTVHVVNNAPNDCCHICGDCNCCCDAVCKSADCCTQFMGSICELLASCCKGCGQIGSCNCNLGGGDCNGCGEACGGCCAVCGGIGSMIPGCGGDADDDAASEAVSQIMENAGEDASLYAIGVEAGKIIYASTMGISAIIKTLEMLNRIYTSWDDSSLLQNDAAREFSSGLCVGGIACAVGYVLPCGGPNTALAFASGAYRLTPDLTAHYLDKQFKERLNANYKQQVGISHPKKNVLTSTEQEKLLQQITEKKSDAEKRDQIARANHYLIKTKNEAHKAMRKGLGGRAANGVQEMFKFFYFFNPCSAADKVLSNACTRNDYFQKNKIANACRQGIDQLKKGELISDDVMNVLAGTDHLNEIRGAAASAQTRGQQVPYITRQPPYVPDSSNNRNNYGSINNNASYMY
jgi:hypothetical protein